MSATTHATRKRIHEKGQLLAQIRNGWLTLCVLLCLCIGITPAHANDTVSPEPEYRAQAVANNETRETHEPALEEVSVPSVPAVPASAATPPAAPLSPRLQGALDYVKSRYKVSREAVHPLFEAVQRISIEHGIDPLLILALIGIESGFNPEAKSRTGGYGLMQIIPRYHMSKIPDGRGANGLMDPAINIKVGTQILDEAIRRAGSMVAGLQSYNGSKKKQKFAARVLAEKARMEKAAQ